MKRLAIAAVLVLATALVGAATPARAHGVKIVVRGGAVTSSGTHVAPHPTGAPRTFVRESVFSPRFIPDVPSNARVFHHHPHTIVVAPRCAQLPGSWSYVWVPQTSTYSVWVAGHWSPEGTWVPGHYAPYTVTTGSYQPIWVPGRWVC